jgi:hypothetical protein
MIKCCWSSWVESFVTSMDGDKMREWREKEKENGESRSVYDHVDRTFAWTEASFIDESWVLRYLQKLHRCMMYKWLVRWLRKRMKVFVCFMEDTALPSSAFRSCWGVMFDGLMDGEGREGSEACRGDRKHHLLHSGSFKMECCVYNKKTRHAFGLRLFSICWVVHS